VQSVARSHIVSLQPTVGTFLGTPFGSNGCQEPQKVHRGPRRPSGQEEYPDPPDLPQGLGTPLGLLGPRCTFCGSWQPLLPKGVPRKVPTVGCEETMCARATQSIGCSISSSEFLVFRVQDS
jgi:hypothetical protein